ncbi:MAG TPA: dockerin type I repeat-containing protein [Acetivibrio sp.]|uniref:dockerin type I repeat-containing protein n=1 Tax=Acetivibrio sp. TaxID=1872092 RepID=UPI002CC5D76B|nr:dockerin type I repeat-containing protein [Acetivibrio sp.]HOM01655.1 dockerin type I repeat-containing protein [Acetivibrio sp.]
MLLVTAFLPAAAFAETLEGTWVKFSPRSENVLISVKPDDTGEYVATVKIKFASTGYRVSYEDVVAVEKGALPDGTQRISFVGSADIEKWTGNSFTVITEETLKYHLGKLDKGIYSFIFKSNNFSKAIEFAVSEGYVNWIPKDKEVSISVVPDENGEYVANVKLTLPHTGFRVSYDPVGSAPEEDLPDGSEKAPFLGAAIIEEWTGPALQVITYKVLSYNLGELKPGIYYFMFKSKGYEQLYKFEVPQNVQIIRYGDLNDDGNANSTDFRLIRKCILERRYDPRADLNEDGIVNSTDLQIFKKYILKIISVIPVKKGTID